MTKIDVNIELLSKNLSQRQQNVLRAIIQLYILNASPVGSRTLSKYLSEKVSPATIRNVMADLEDLNLISHPHTSAGRIPTDLGYRFYVDSLAEMEELQQKELLALQNTLNSSETMLKDASKILGILSNYLSVVSIPQIENLKVLKLDLIQVASDKLLVVLALDSNYVKTVTLEVGFEYDQGELNYIVSYLNEKVAGKPLTFIKDNFKEIITESEFRDAPLVRLFVDSIDYIMDIKDPNETIHIAGTQNLLEYPEFNAPDRMKGIIELVESEDVIIHLLDKYGASDEDITVLIGSEMQDDMLDDYSLVISKYKIGTSSGSIGIIGPKRMQYSKMMSLVKQTATFLDKS